MNIQLVVGFAVIFLKVHYCDSLASTLILKTTCGCYGNDTSLNSLVADCFSGERIVIESTFRGAKQTKQASSCPYPVISAAATPASCCRYNASDCVINLTSVDIPDVYHNCTGATSCTQVVTTQFTLGHCPQKFAASTNYMCMNFYCYPVSNTTSLPICDTTGSSISSTQVYFYDDNYPLGISHAGCCTCQLTASAQSAIIELFMIDLELQNVSSTCLQHLFVLDNEILSKYGCNTQNRYNATSPFLTSNGSSLSVTLRSNRSMIGNGRAWFSATVSNGGLTLACSSVPICPDATPSTLSPTTNLLSTSLTSISMATSSINTIAHSVLSSTTATITNTAETWLFGLSVATSSILIGGIALIVLVLFIIACTFGYFFGKSKTFDGVQVKPNSGTNEFTNRDSPPPPYLPTGQSTMITSTSAINGGRANRKYGMFVYRPFENQLPSISDKRSKLTPVE